MDELQAKLPQDAPSSVYNRFVDVGNSYLDGASPLEVKDFVMVGPKVPSKITGITVYRRVQPGQCGAGGRLGLYLSISSWWARRPAADRAEHVHLVDVVRHLDQTHRDLTSVRAKAILWLLHWILVGGYVGADAGDGLRVVCR